MMQNQKYTRLKPLGFILSGFIGFVTSLVGYILTAIDSYYDDGFGLSISYGSKDLLMLTIISLLVVIYGIYLLVNVHNNKKGIPYSDAMFVGLLSFLVFVFFLSFVFKPIIKGDIEFSLTYITMIISSILALSSSVLASILAYHHFKKKTSYLSLVFSYLIFLLYCLSISLYAIANGISLSGSGVAICYFVMVFAEILQLFSSLLNLSDARLR